MMPDGCATSISLSFSRQISSLIDTVHLKTPRSPRSLSTRLEALHPMLFRLPDVQQAEAFRYNCGHRNDFPNELLWLVGLF